MMPQRLWGRLSSLRTRFPAGPAGLKAGWVLCILALMLTACGKTPQPQQAAEPTSPTATIDEINGATVTGKVIFDGDKPAPIQIDMSASPVCARAHAAKPATTDEVVVNSNGTLRNTFIWVKSGLPNATWPTPSTPVVLDQVGCVYTPHVLGIMTGQRFEIRNSDATNHNVHTTPAGNEVWNTSQPPKGDPMLKTFARPEIMVPVKCNVHPWMKAYVGVVAHPFFAVTDDDGTFTIKGLPPGAYDLEAWHEKYGRQERHVTLSPKESMTVDFSFKG